MTITTATSLILLLALYFTVKIIIVFINLNLREVYRLGDLLIIITCSLWSLFYLLNNL